MLYPFNDLTEEEETATERPSKMRFFVGVYPDGQARSWHLGIVDLDDYIARYMTGLFPFVEVQIADCPDEWACNCTLDFLSIKREHGGHWPSTETAWTEGRPVGSWHPSLGVRA